MVQIVHFKIKIILIFCTVFYFLNIYASERNVDHNLLLAAEKSDYYGIISALSKGAYINAKNSDGQTALIILAKKNSEKISYNTKYNIIKLLLSKGADISIKDNAEKTAMDYHKEDPAAESETKIRDLLTYYPDSSKNRNLIENNMNPSYICFLSEEISDPERPINDLIYEAEINVPFNLFGITPSSDYNQFLLFVAGLNFRMYRESSSPVKTPSFMPKLIYYFWWNSLNKNLPASFDFLYFSFMLSHHSNGQFGNFYDEDGKINTESGNFSTNYGELSVSTIYNRNLWINFSYQQHILGVNREEELNGQYETGRVILSIRKFLFRDSVQIFGSAGYITSGRKYIQSPESANSEHPAIEGIRAKPVDNLHLQVQLHWRIPCIWRICFHENISLFIKYDYGYDYYNIYFQEKMNRIQIGLAGLINR